MPYWQRKAKIEVTEYDIDKTETFEIIIGYYLNNVEGLVTEASTVVGFRIGKANSFRISTLGYLLKNLST